MKVRRIEPKKVFQPIEIILENEGEARDLWHVLNCDDSESLEDYCKSGAEEMPDTDHLYEVFNSVYRPA